MGSDSKQTLLIKTVFGRLLLDTVKAGLPFSLKEIASLEGEEAAPAASNVGWEFIISDVAPRLADSITQCAAELNIFHFVEDEKGKLHKCWYYDMVEPVVSYNKESLVMKVKVDSRSPYSNEKV